MGHLKPHAKIRTTFPDDAIEEGDDFVFWSGRNIAAAITGHLRTAGYLVRPPVHCEIDGWELDAELGKIRFWLRVNNVGDGEATIFTEHMGSFWRRHRDQYEKFLTTLDAALRGDERFTAVAWFMQNEILGDGPGHQSPV
jgi:hypothetical protein